MSSPFRTRLGWAFVALVGVLAGVFVWRSLPMIDLEVYRSGGYKLLHGIPLYAGKVEGVWLPFTYPPFAAVLFTPFVLIGAWGGGVVISILSLAALARACQLLVRVRLPDLDRAGQRDATGLLWAAAALAEPITATLGFGQINLLILWLVLEDVLGGHRRGRGVLVGIATGLKLTPGMFLLFYLVVGKRAEALRAAVALAATIALGIVVQPQQGWLYWNKLAYDDTRVGGVAYIANQSLNGVIWRLSGPGGIRPLWLVLAMVTTGTALWAARRLWRSGEQLSAVAITALGMLLVSPISWSHHWVWALPAAVALTGIARRSHAKALLATGLVIFYSRGIFRVPNTGDQEYAHSLWQQVVGNSYAIWALGALIVMALDAYHRAPIAPLDERVSQPAQ